MDVHIIGGGPSGSISALSAIRNGFNPIISEEHKEIGLPTNCSGLFSKTGLDSLKGFIDYKKIILNELNGAIMDFSGVQVKIEKKSTVAYSLNRSLLDQHLSSKAEDEGVKIEFGKRIKGDFKSNNIIGADGPASFTASYFKFPKIEKLVCTAQTFTNYFCEDPKKAYVYYSNKSFPGFFGWVIPENEEYSEIGCGTILPNNPKPYFDLFLKKLGATPENISYFTIPISTRESTSYSDGKRNVLLVGDAAGQTKATTGGGVIFGGSCATLAGKHANNPYKYEEEWKNKFGSDLLTHQLIQTFLEKRSERELQLIGKLMNVGKFDHYLSKYGDMDKPSKMLGLNMIFQFLTKTFS